MNWIVCKYVEKICYVYIDNVAIFSSTLKEHHQNVRLIMQALQEAGIIVSLSKSKLYTDEIKFSGHIISSRGIEVNPNKAFKVNDWTVPRNQGDI